MRHDLRMRAVLRVLRDAGWLILCLVLAIGGVGVFLEGGLWNRVVGVVGVAMFGFATVVAVPNLLIWDRPRTIGPPSPLPDEELGRDWFVDEDPEENRFTPAEATFLAKLRDRARLPGAGVTSDVARSGDMIMAVVWVTDAPGWPHLFSLGLQIKPGALRGDRLDRGGLPSEPSSIAFMAEGPDDQLISDAIAWLDNVLRRPVERVEWWCAGRPYAMRYQFADTRDGLVETFNRKLAPWGLYRRLRAAGHVDTHEPTRIDATKLGEPDATLAVRVEGRAIPTPQPSEFRWYDSHS